MLVPLRSTSAQLKEPSGLWPTLGPVMMPAGLLIDRKMVDLVGSLVARAFWASKKVPALGK